MASVFLLCISFVVSRRLPNILLFFSSFLSLSLILCSLLFLILFTSRLYSSSCMGS